MNVGAPIVGIVGQNSSPLHASLQSPGQRPGPSMAAPYHVDACQPTSTISILTPNARTYGDENGGGRHRQLRSSGQSARRELLGPQASPLAVNSFVLRPARSP
jgi:hypothetical protein